MRNEHGSKTLFPVYLDSFFIACTWCGYKYNSVMAVRCKQCRCSHSLFTSKGFVNSADK